MGALSAPTLHFLHFACEGNCLQVTPWFPACVFEKTASAIVKLEMRTPTVTTAASKPRMASLPQNRAADSAPDVRMLTKEQRCLQDDWRAAGGSRHGQSVARLRLHSGLQSEIMNALPASRFHKPDHIFLRNV
jgi:hypothetical protein